MSTGLSLALPEDAWPSARSRIHAEVGTEAFEAWFGAVRLDQFDGATAVLSVPSPFLRRRIEARYGNLVLRALKSEVRYIRRIRVVDRGPSRWYVTTTTPMLPAPTADQVMPPRPTEPWSTPQIVEVVGAFVSKIKRIQQVTADRFGISVSSMNMKRRTADLVLPRHIAIFVAYRTTAATLPELGRRCGGLDHTSVLHAQRRITRKIDTDPAVREAVMGVLADLGYDEIPPDRPGKAPKP